MRIVVALLLLSVVPGVSSAETILFTTADESRIEYGDWGAQHDGFSFFSNLSIKVDGVERPEEWQPTSGTDFTAYSGPLLSKTFETNGAGEIVRTTYVYDGGTFEMSFDLRRQGTGEEAFGDFNAPILGSMTLIVDEGGDPFGDRVDAYFELGRGLFDASLADALRIRRRTHGGFVRDPHLTDGEGDPTSGNRTAWEGAPDVTIDVPEPTSLGLLGASGLGLLLRSRRRQRI